MRRPATGRELAVYPLTSVRAEFSNEILVPSGRVPRSGTRRDATVEPRLSVMMWGRAYVGQVDPWITRITYSIQSWAIFV